MKEGYPERVCDLCQLQLNTFHAFVRKAKNTSTRFENMLHELKQNCSSFINQEESVNKDTKTETSSTNDIEFELSNDDENDGDIAIEMELVQLTGENNADFKIVGNEVEGLYQ